MDSGVSAEAVVWIDEADSDATRVVGGWWEPSRHGDDDEALTREVARAVARLGDGWQRGLERADDVGKAAAAFVGTLDDGALPAGATLEQVAGAASLIGAYDEHGLAAFAEQIVRQRGVRFALEVLVEVWGQATNYHNPSWPKNDEGLAVWMRAMAPDESSAFDASVSYGKGRLAFALRKRALALPETRDEMRGAVDALWERASMPARAALMLAANDAERASEIVELVIAKARPYPHWPRRVLPFVVRDVETLERLRQAGAWDTPTLAMVHNVGREVIVLCERVLDSKIPNTIRAYVLRTMQNLRGPRTARAFARYAEKSSVASEVRAYFTRYPELLDAVSAEDEGHQKRLDKLRRALDKAKPQAKKSKTKTKTKAKTKAKAKKRVPGNPRG